jgi:two-component system, NtrC family, response regulator HydG
MTEKTELSEGDFLMQTERSETGALPADYNLEQLEKMAIVEALNKHQGNISRTAEKLGLTRASLYRRMEKYGL